jgi:hypothetical protein
VEIAFVSVIGPNKKALAPWRWTRAALPGSGDVAGNDDSPEESKERAFAKQGSFHRWENPAPLNVHKKSAK